MKYILGIIFLAAVWVLSGCASVPVEATGINTEVDASTDVKADVGGDATGIAADTDIRVSGDGSALAFTQVTPWICGTIILCVLAACCRNLSATGGWSFRIEAGKDGKI